jgi:hypothetical protein
MSESMWTAADEGREENRRGYDDQMQWLQGKSIPEARHALAERLATLASSEYNGGGNAATCDYIERLKIRGEGQQS